MKRLPPPSAAASPSLPSMCVTSDRQGALGPVGGAILYFQKWDSLVKAGLIFLP